MGRVHLTFDCRRNRSDMFEKTEEATEVSTPNHVGPFLRFLGGLKRLEP